MYKLLFDSDSLIKVTKAGFLENVVNSFKVYITDDVYNETVEEGIERFYEDADKIKNLADNKKISIIKRDKYVKITKPKQSFGKGEVSVSQVHKKDYLTVTDDLSFVSYLNNISIKNISSAHLITALVKKDKISKQEAYYYLENLKPLIRKEIYELVKKDIKGEEK